MTGNGTPPELWLYVQHACEICDEARLELESASLPFVLFYVTASPEPGQALVWNPDGSTEAVPRAHFDGGFPMLVDRGTRLFYLGLPAIRQRAHLK